MQSTKVSKTTHTRGLIFIKGEYLFTHYLILWLKIFNRECPFLLDVFCFLFCFELVLASLGFPLLVKLIKEAVFVKSSW